jgi:HrpA-like RNA helicase
VTEYSNLLQEPKEVCETKPRKRQRHDSPLREDEIGHEETTKKEHTNNYDNSDEIESESDEDCLVPKVERDLSLPIFSYRDKILSSLTSHQIVIVVGETGCGKTTQLAQFVIDDWKGVHSTPPQRRRVAISNPRRVGAITVARRVSQERGVVLGREVGFSVRFTGLFFPPLTFHFRSNFKQNYYQIPH